MGAWGVRCKRLCTFYVHMRNPSSSDVCLFDSALLARALYARQLFLRICGCVCSRMHAGSEKTANARKYTYAGHNTSMFTCAGVQKHVYIRQVAIWLKGGRAGLVVVG